MNERIYTKALRKGRLLTLMMIVALMLTGVAAGGSFVYLLSNQDAWVPALHKIADAYNYKKGKVVRVTTDNYVYNGDYTDSKGEVIGWCYIIWLNDSEGQYLIAKTKNSYEEESSRRVHDFVGELKDNKFYQEDLGYFQELSEWSEQQVKESLLPLMLDEEYSPNFYYLIALAFAGFSGSIAVAVISVIKSKKNKDLLKGLPGLENAEPAFGNELTESATLRLKKFIISRNWFFSKIWNNTFLLPAGEIVWAYETTTTHTYNSINTGKTHTLNLALSNGKMLNIPAKLNDIHAVLEHLASYGKTIVGFTYSLQANWGQDKQKFIDDWRNPGRQETENENDR